MRKIATIVALAGVISTSAIAEEWTPQNDNFSMYCNGVTIVVDPRAHQVQTWVPRHKVGKVYDLDKYEYQKEVKFGKFTMQIYDDGEGAWLRWDNQTRRCIVSTED
jgi:hypothetical protein